MKFFFSSHPLRCSERYITLLRKTEKKKKELCQSKGLLKIVKKIIFKYYNERLFRLGQKYNLDIGLYSCDEGLKIWHNAGGIVINQNARIGKNLTLHGCNCIGNDGINPKLAPQMGDNIHMGFGSCVIGDVSIADGIWIAAGAVVTTSFDEPNIVIGGVPARKIKNL